MALRILSLKHILFFFTLAFIIATIFIFYELNGQESCACSERGANLMKFNAGHKLAILIPFRDRFTELLQFVPYISRFLNNQKVFHRIYIINQVDEYRFNRASLLNVGFLHVKNLFDYVALHDVDLLPANPRLSYHYPKTGIYHVASPEYHPKYNYPTFLGGILLITSEAFENVNGMSNQYWGWGLEDDEFYARIKEKSYIIERPSNLSTTTETTFSHIHNKYMRKRDMVKCYNQWEVTRKRDRRTGLNTTYYSIDHVTNIEMDGIKVDIINVELHCNKTITPWCDCRHAKSNPVRPKHSDDNDVIVPLLPKKTSKKS